MSGGEEERWVIYRISKEEEGGNSRGRGITEGMDGR